MKNGWNDLQEQLWRLVHRWESVPGRQQQAACIKSVFSTHSQGLTHRWLTHYSAREAGRSCATRAFNSSRSCSLRLRRRFDTSASRALVLPSGYKAFSKQRRLLSDQDCPRQHHTAGKHGCGDSYWWVVTKLSPSFHQFVSMLSPSALLNLSALIRRKKKQNN